MRYLLKGETSRKVQCLYLKNRMGSFKEYINQDKQHRNLKIGCTPHLGSGQFAIHSLKISYSMRRGRINKCEIIVLLQPIKKPLQASMAANQLFQRKIQISKTKDLLHKRLGLNQVILLGSKSLTVPPHQVTNRVNPLVSNKCSRISPKRIQKSWLQVTIYLLSTFHVWSRRSTSYKRIWCSMFRLIGWKNLLLIMSGICLIYKRTNWVIVSVQCRLDSTIVSVKWQTADVDL